MVDLKEVGDGGAKLFLENYKQLVQAIDVRLLTRRSHD